jgi:hypothetical protein
MAWVALLVARLPQRRRSVPVFPNRDEHNAEKKTLISMLLLRYLQLSSRFGWGLGNLVALLCKNLFTHRDLMSWLDQPFATPPDPQDNPQAVMTFA